ncbi:MAG: short chain dehydrogenase, partial [Acidobacteria bacterium 37-65-4]
DGANVVIAAKTTEPDPKLPGTIYSAAQEIEAAGGKALPVQVDVRDEEQVMAAVRKAVDAFGGIDILVNNASAINLRGTLELPVARFDLMFQVNARATFICSKACIPYLLKAQNPHILTLAPPLNTDPKWFAGIAPYTMTKYGMTMLALGMAGEFRKQGVACNALWPKTVIATAAVMNLLGGEDTVRKGRTPAIVADAAHAILTRPSRECTGNCFVDEDVLRAEGVTDFEPYAITPGGELMQDFFL